MGKSEKAVERRVEPLVGHVVPCCSTAPIWYQWPCGNVAVQCPKCRRIGCDSKREDVAITYWNAEILDAESVPSFPPNK